MNIPNWPGLALCVAAIIAIVLLFGGGSYGKPRHHRAAPHHARLVKHPRILGVQVIVPARAVAPRKPAVHRRRSHRRR